MAYATDPAHVRPASHTAHVPPASHPAHMRPSQPPCSHAPQPLTLLPVASLGGGLLLSKSTRHARSRMNLPSLYFWDLSYALMYFQPTYAMHSRQKMSCAYAGGPQAHAHVAEALMHTRLAPTHARSAH